MNVYWMYNKNLYRNLKKKLKTLKQGVGENLSYMHYELTKIKDQILNY